MTPKERDILLRKAYEEHRRLLMEVRDEKMKNHVTGEIADAGPRITAAEALIDVLRDTSLEDM